MILSIDGCRIVANPGESLLDMVVRLGLDTVNLSSKPIAAQIAGEVFNLNYIPLRKNAADNERTSIRRTMAASQGVVNLVRYEDPAGRDVYYRTAQFVIFLALHKLLPGVRAKMSATVGNALYVEVCSDVFSFDDLKMMIKRIVEDNIPLIRERVPLNDAIEHYENLKQPDKAELLRIRKETYFDQYRYEDFTDYYYGELAPSTGYLQVWDILPVDGGFMFLYPDDRNPEIVSSYEQMPNFYRVCKEGERWCELMECQTVSDLNRLVRNGGIRELIRVNEALHEKRYSQIADDICNRGAQIVMLAGPSSSGKTTSANRLATQLRVHGKQPVLISLDDYYFDRELIKPDKNGNIDLEHINTIDTELFKDHIIALLNGGAVNLPAFDFKSGKRFWPGHKLVLNDNTVIIVEGLHALNPVLLPVTVDASNVFKLYISPLLPLNLDDHNRIPTSLLRLLRRTVRDYNTRGASVQKTMEMWESVRRGEKRWIFPYQETADAIFNSSTLYELAILKKYIYPLLLQITPEEACYEQVRSLVKILNYVIEADVDDEIPPISLVREFIGGNHYYQ